MFDWQSVLRETAVHLHRMAHTPGFRRHAVERRDALLADPLWAGLDKVLEEMREVRDEPPA